MNAKMMNFVNSSELKVNKVNKFCIVSLVVLSSIHYTEIFINLLSFIELYFDGNPMGWDGTGMNCCGMGWDRKICPMDKPGNTLRLVVLRASDESYLPCTQVNFWLQ